MLSSYFLFLQANVKKQYLHIILPYENRKSFYTHILICISQSICAISATSWIYWCIFYFVCREWATEITDDFYQNILKFI